MTNPLNRLTLNLMPFLISTAKAVPKRNFGTHQIYPLPNRTPKAYANMPPEEFKELQRRFEEIRTIPNKHKVIPVVDRDAFDSVLYEHLQSDLDIDSQIGNPKKAQSDNPNSPPKTPKPSQEMSPERFKELQEVFQKRFAEI